jgi:chaperonin GroEL
MNQDNLYTGQDARQKLMDGIVKVAEAVSATLGTSGNNSIIEVIENPQHYVTNDGYSIANSIKLADPLEEMGRKILLESINRANRQSGDGSSSTATLTAAILKEGMKYIDRYSPMEIKNSLESCIPLIESFVNSQKKEITVDSVAQVATISAEDEEIGKTIQEIYQKIGKDGIIDWDVSKTAKDSYTIGSGVTIHDAGYVSPYMCDIDESGRFSNNIRWKNPKILLCRQKITSASDFEELFSTLFAKNCRELVIFCDEIEVPVIVSFVQTRALRGFKSVVVKMPVIWKEEWWQDVALATGAKIIDSVSGLSLANMTTDDLGTVENITITKDATFLDGVKDLSVRIAVLQEEGSDESLQRAQRLNTKTARYFVGAHSDSALAYRRLKVEDAINAANCALKNGVVPGGGVALLNVSKQLKNIGCGGFILKEALQSPINCIIANSGVKRDDVSKIFSTDVSLTGFNSKTRDIEQNMITAGILDPTDVVLNSIRNAIGVAASVLTVGTVVTLPREEQLIQPPIVR